MVNLNIQPRIQQSRSSRAAGEITAWGAATVVVLLAVSLGIDIYRNRNNPNSKYRKGLGWMRKSSSQEAQVESILERSEKQQEDVQKAVNAAEEVTKAFNELMDAHGDNPLVKELAAFLTPTPAPTAQPGLNEGFGASAELAVETPKEKIPRAPRPPKASVKANLKAERESHKSRTPKKPTPSRTRLKEEIRAQLQKIED